MSQPQAKNLEATEEGRSSTLSTVLTNFLMLPSLNTKIKEIICGGTAEQM